jgi:glycosyltransferase involved in cell wall biosynthesis
VVDINLVAPINHLGYGVVGYNVLKSLIESGASVALFPIGEPDWVGNETTASMINDAITKSHLYNGTAPSIRIWHQFGLDMFPGNGPRIGWPIFELDKFNEREKLHLSNVDALFVCSQWAKDVIRDNGIDVPTFVVPLGIDDTIFKCDIEERKSRPTWTRDTTVFINIGKWEKRKGHDVLLEAFCEAFNTEDEVELWMINDNPFIGGENLIWKKRYVNSTMGRNVKFFRRFDKHEHLAKIFNHVDCGVFPSHAEGWNLEIPEMMACGAHVIATDYSGHTEFLNDSNSFKLTSTGLEAANDGKWFNGQGNWCTFDKAQLVTHMQEVHRRKQDGTLDINQAGIETAKQFTWANTINKIVESLEVINEANVAYLARS